MKIVYIHESIAHKGGLERIFVDKMNYLADRLQYEVYLLTASQGNTPVSFPCQAFRFGSPISFAIPIPISQTSVGSKKIG